MSPTRTKTKKKRSTRKASKKTTKKRVRKTAKRESTSYAQPLQTKESDLVWAWFRHLARRRGAWLQHLWLSDGALEGRATVTHAELAGILADDDSPEAEFQWASERQPVRGWLDETNSIKRALESSDSRFQRLGRVFGLSEEELDLMRLAAAVAFDPQLGRVCAYLQDHSGRTYLTEELATRLLGHGRSTQWTPEMNVFRWNLIERREVGVGEPTALFCDSQIRDWLLGKSTLDELLVGSAMLLESNGNVLPEWPVHEIASWIGKLLSESSTPRLRVVVTAPQGGGKRKFAAAVCEQLEMPLLIVNADATDGENWSRLFMHAQRQVFLDTAAIAWTGKTISQRSWPTTQIVFPIQFVLCEPGEEPAQTPGTVDRLVRLPIPSAETREELWRKSSKAAAKWSADDRRKLAEQHNVWPGDIERAAYLGAETPDHAALIVREAARSRFGNLAHILECPFINDDLVVTEAVRQLLKAITFEAQERIAFWRQPEARRLFPQGRGLVALFSGPSGTGKTMSAQVIAAELNQDLCRVNVAQLVSKWVGETPKNVEQVIRVAAENDAVLFFDEADALFARRATEIRDAQDKFANTDTAFLLQAIESYPGVAFLATNLKSNIDPAFLRRIRYVVDFPKPGQEQQKLLWTKLITNLSSKDRAEALAPVIDLLSSSADLTGAQIKFALLAGLFESRADKKELNASHLLTGVDRELAKEGRGLGPKERERILKSQESK